MRKSLVAAVLAAFAVLTALAGASTQGDAPLAPAEAERPAAAEFVPGEVIVRFRDGVSRAEQSRTVRSEGGRIDRSLTLEDTKVVQLAEGADVEAAAAELEDDPDVLSAEPNYIRHASALTAERPAVRRSSGRCRRSARRRPGTRPRATRT